MGKGLTKREKKKKIQREVTKSLKAKRMQRGGQTSTPEPVAKPISYAKQQKLRLENMTPELLKSLVYDKCLDSQIYYKENVEASPTEFNFNGFKFDLGLKLEFTKADSGREHYFGFDLYGNHIQVHYTAVREDGLNYDYKTKTINPKAFSARKLVDIIGDYK